MLKPAMTWRFDIGMRRAVGRCWRLWLQATTNTIWFCRWERRASRRKAFLGQKSLKDAKSRVTGLECARRRSTQMIDIDSYKVTANQMLQFTAPMPSEMIPGEIAALRYRMVTELKAVCASLRSRSFTRFLAE
jgi:hypothetical protein